MNQIQTALCLVLATMALTAPAALSQSPQPSVPAWQTAAGGKMSFDVASIRPTEPGVFHPSNFAFYTDNADVPDGGLLTADFPVLTYIEFAYKIVLAPSERKAVLANLPKWVDNQKYEIHARASGNPTKDQMRLMMQSLLADRFKLAVHFENRQVSVLAITLVKSGKPGPSLRPHSEGPPCDAAPSTNVFPTNCDSYQAIVRPNHLTLLGARNTTIPLLAHSFTLSGDVDRPVIDQTGLTGRYDFTLEWDATPSRPASNTDAASEPQGASFFQALKEQLGLKLEPTKAPMDILVVDHIELPSEN